MSPNNRVWMLSLVIALCLPLDGIAQGPTDARSEQRGGDEGRILTLDHYVNHISTVPAIAGRRVKIFVRERVQRSQAQLYGRRIWNRKVVLMVHGGTYPSVPDYDLRFKEYSWMRYLAEAGFDVFAMDMNGYGDSARPTMDNPCNVEPALQSLLVPGTIRAPCPPTYPFQLNTAESERDELNRVIDYIRHLRGVNRVSLIGWSGGGFRTGTYTSLNPEKVDKLIILASSNYNRSGSSNPPAQVPAPGFPMTIQSRAILEQQRWGPDVTCDGQIEPGVQDAVWHINMAFDPVGATWGPGVVRAPNRTLWGWNAEAAGRIRIPTLVMVGENDGLLASMRLLHEDLGSGSKVLLEIACASHFVVWEAQHRVLHEASESWLLHGSVKGAREGRLHVDFDGRYRKVD